MSQGTPHTWLGYSHIKLVFTLTYTPRYSQVPYTGLKYSQIKMEFTYKYNKVLQRT